MVLLMGCGLTLHVDELPGLFVVGGINLVVEFLVWHVRNFRCGNDEPRTNSPLQMVLLKVPEIAINKKFNILAPILCRKSSMSAQFNYVI